MGYPEILLGVEYDGREHLTPERALRDLARQAYLSTLGWTVLRFSAAAVFRPAAVAARVRWELARRGVIVAERTPASRAGPGGAGHGDHGRSVAW